MCFAQGTIPNPDVTGLDNSTYKFHHTAFVKFESHYDLRCELRPDKSGLVLSESHYNIFGLI